MCRSAGSRSRRPRSAAGSCRPGRGSSAGAAARRAWIALDGAPHRRELGRQVAQQASLSGRRCGARRRSCRRAHRLGQARRLDRLDQVVERALLERLHRVLIVSGDEHEVRAAADVAAPPRRRTGPACARRGSSTSGCGGVEELDRLAAVAGLARPRRARARPRQLPRQRLAQQRLVVGDQGRRARAISRCFACGKSSSGRHAAGRALRDPAQVRIVAEHELQPLAQGGQSGAEARPGRAEAAAVSLTRTRQRPPRRRTSTSMLPPSSLGIDAVAHRVFDQRQQRHRRAAQRARLGVHVQPVTAAGRACACASARGRPGPAPSPAPGSRPARAAAAPRRADRRSGCAARADACGEPASTSACTFASVLNRKCGATCACSRRRRASSAWRSSSLRSSSNVDRLVAGERLALPHQRRQRGPRREEQAEEGQHHEAVERSLSCQNARRPRPGRQQVERQRRQRHRHPDPGHLQHPAGEPRRQPSRPRSKSANTRLPVERRGTPCAPAPKRSPRPSRARAAIPSRRRARAARPDAAIPATGRAQVQVPGPGPVQVPGPVQDG